MPSEVQQIFAENIIGTLATVNPDGSPWSTPVHVVTDGEAVYWFSKPTVQHSQNITRDSRVSLTLFSPDATRGPIGAYVNGTVELLDEAADAQARQVFIDRAGSMPKTFENFSAYRLPLGSYDNDKSTGNCWYFYS